MKLLLLSKKFPFPLKDGESQAIHGLSKSLAELGCQVHLLAMNTSKHFYESGTLPPEMDHYASVEAVTIDNRLSLRGAVGNLFSRDSYHVSRFVSSAFSAALERKLKRETFDFIQLETLYLAPYIPLLRRLTDSPIAMRAHNVEHEIWERTCANLAFGPKRIYLRYLTDKLRRYEHEQLAAYDLLLPITERDGRRFRQMGYHGNYLALPLGLDADHLEPDYNSFRRPISLSFIGSLDWMPNLEGLEWFLRDVWPAAKRCLPALEFHVAGRNMPERMRRRRTPGVQFHGEVPCSQGFINAHSVMVVPLLSGSGMRAKILEAMALGKVVITTSLGLEGISAEHRRHVLVADTPREFVQALLDTHAMNGSLERMGRSARTLFEEVYDRRRPAARLLDVYLSRLNERRAPVALRE